LTVWSDFWPVPVSNPIFSALARLLTRRHRTGIALYFVLLPFGARTPRVPLVGGRGSAGTAQWLRKEHDSRDKNALGLVHFSNYRILEFTSHPNTHTYTGLELELNRCIAAAGFLTAMFSYIDYSHISIAID